MSTPHDTPPKPPVARTTHLGLRASVLAGISLLLFMVAAIVSQFWWARENDVLPKDHSLERLLEGGVTHDIAKRLRDIPFNQEAATLQRELNWLTLGDLGDRVRVGCPGWLFLADELTIHPNAETNAQTRAQTVIKTQQALAEQGVQLVIAVVPDKSRILDTQRCSLSRSAGFEHRITSWVNTLREHDVAAIDLTSALQPLGEQAYLRSDSHWTASGAGAAAHRIAAQIRETGVELTPERDYEVSVSAPTTYVGDLVRLAGVQGLSQDHLPASDQVMNYRYTQLASEVSDEAALFGDVGTPTLALVGTSFSRTSDFENQLARALGVELASFAKDGAMFGGSLNPYFKSAAWKQTPPKLLLWEINERDLQAPLDKDDHINIARRE